MVRSGSDNAYGIYLSQMLFITALVWLGWGHLSSTIPWPLLCLLTVAIVFACGIALTSVLARTPLAVPLTGRKQAALVQPAVPAARPAARRRDDRSQSDCPQLADASSAIATGPRWPRDHGRTDLSRPEAAALIERPERSVT